MSSEINTEDRWRGRHLRPVRLVGPPSRGRPEMLVDGEWKGFCKAYLPDGTLQADWNLQVCYCLP